MEELQALNYLVAMIKKQADYKECFDAISPILEMMPSKILLKMASEFEKTLEKQTQEHGRLDREYEFSSRELELSLERQKEIIHQKMMPMKKDKKEKLLQALNYLEAMIYKQADSKESWDAIRPIFKMMPLQILRKLFSETKKNLEKAKQKCERLVRKRELCSRELESLERQLEIICQEREECEKELDDLNAIQEQIDKQELKTEEEIEDAVNAARKKRMLSCPQTEEVEEVTEQDVEMNQM